MWDQSELANGLKGCRLSCVLMRDKTKNVLVSVNVITEFSTEGHVEEVSRSPRKKVLPINNLTNFIHTFDSG